MTVSALIQKGEKACVQYRGSDPRRGAGNSLSMGQGWRWALSENCYIKILCQK